ncbi:LPS export ABC transporter periplasmic protein LptC [Agriterribacter sp.]|uniref:LPS export ABC transporter periplasmic protein LptC n=1 Tax=Agriterribacter sp. TaxID=2821509 RepID=UPI002CADA2B1|nr:LPS export ABC transporter periplasmic protein LptC [Agriterribacter sp.]HTN05649.1 LPS export ABC transporter periplasmic protein LptC [Agriterribacter sp.]
MRTGGRKQFFTCASLYVILFCLAGCENSEQEIRELTEKKIGVDEARTIETYFSQAGKMQAKLTAPLMYRYQDTLPRVEFPNALHVDFYDDSLQVESVLDALYGRYIEGQKKMYLRDSVVVIQKFNQDTLRCQELWWDQNKEIFYTDKPIRVTKKDGTVLPGQGLEASQDFRNIKIINPSQGILPVPEGEFSGAPVQDSSATRDSGFSRNRPFPPIDSSASIKPD